MAEVIGGGTLQKAIEDNEIPTPDLLGYQAWISWRAGAGMRPTQRKSGHGATSAQEAELWRATMSRIYGENWRTLLEDAELLRAEAAEEEAIKEKERRMREAVRRRLDAEAAIAGIGMEDEDELDREEERNRRGGTRSDGGSSEAPSMRTLGTLIRKPFDPSSDTLTSYEEKVRRLATALESSGNPLPSLELQEIMLRANYMSLISQQPSNEAKIGWIKQTMASLLVDDASGRDLVEQGLSILKELLEKHGGRLSSAAGKLFSSPSKSDDDHRTPGKTPVGQARPEEGAQEVNELRRELFSAKKRLLDYERDRGNTGSPQPSERQSEVAEVANTIAEALKGQTAALKNILDKASAPSKKRSTIQVSPKVAWPILNDSCSDHRSVQEFYDSFESTVQLANDGEGMNELEMLTTLKACLKEHRLKSYELIYKRHHAAGTLKADPGKVYQEIKAKHLMFAETREEREIRVLEEGDRLDKGRLTAYQFETLWEEHLNERAEVGLGCTAREYLLQYYRKIGPALAKEVRKDKRFRPDGTGTGKEVFRGAATWEEAHEVVKEVEAMTAGQKAITNATFSNASGRRNGSGGNDHSFSYDNQNKNQKDRKQLACFKMRDQGTCPLGKDCPYSHDSKIVAEAKKKQKEKAAGKPGAGDRVNEQNQSDSVAATKGSKGNGKGKKNGGKGTGNSGEKKLCKFFNTERGCDKGKDCEFAHKKGDKPRREQSRGRGKRGNGDKDKDKNTKGAGRGGKGDGTATGPGAAVSLGGVPPPAGIKANVSFANPFRCFTSHVCQEGSLADPDNSSRVRAHDTSEQKPLDVAPTDQINHAKVGNIQLNSLDDLPQNWWVEAPNLKGGYQYESEVEILGKKVPLLLDGCAGCNSCPEELVLAMIEYALKQNIMPDDPKFPVAQLERWPLKEVVTGLAASAPIELKGGAVLKMSLVDVSKKKSKEILVRVKICAKGTSDWSGIILGGRALDCAERGGLGHRTTDTAHVLDGAGIMLPRIEKAESFPDKAYMMKEQVVERVSSFDSFATPLPVKTRIREWELLKYNGPRLVVEPGEGSWISVEKSHSSGEHTCPQLCEVVVPVEKLEEEPWLEVAPGLWKTAATKGHVFVTNPKEGNPMLEAVTLESGQTVGAVVPGAGFQQFCEDCGTTTAFAVTDLPSDVQKCSRCDSSLVELADEDRLCASCGSEKVTFERYHGCEDCRPIKNKTNKLKAGAVSFIACTFASVCAAAVASRAATGGIGDTRFSPVYHIVEEPGRVDLMAEELPTDFYYERSRARMSKLFPEATVHVLDHIEALEAFLDKSIVAGFSFGVEKASVCVTEGSLLGHQVGRFGLRSDPEKVKAIVEFPPLKEKQHIQQFLGCTNFLRWYLPPQYAFVAKQLGDYAKGAVAFPDEGLGPGKSSGDLAVQAIKLMAKRAIELSVLDECAAITGTRPLEQVADCCGFALGGSALQMKPDLTGFNVLVTHSKGLLPAQQAWPPLTLEGFAQLEVRRAVKKALGPIRCICWTDHANWTKQTTTENVEVKHLRWVSELVSDGSQIRSLAGRSAKLGDGYSRNPPERDALIEQRSKDLEGLIGQYRGFSLDQYLSDYCEDEPSAWSIGDGALPDSVATIEEQIFKVMEKEGLNSDVRVLFVPDYVKEMETEDYQRELRKMLRFSFPSRNVQIVEGRGPFEDDDGISSHFEKSTKMGLSVRKLVQAVRTDMMTSVVKLLRNIHLTGAKIVVGAGQGAMIALVAAWPLVTEAALMLRNVQPEECYALSAAWGNVRLIVGHNLRMSKKSVGLELLKQSLPEAFQAHPLKAIPRFGILDRNIPNKEEMMNLLTALGIPEMEHFGKIAWKDWENNPPREMWKHTGKCSCGRRTFLFGQCMRCIAADQGVAVENEEETEMAEKQDLEKVAEKGSGPEVDVICLSSADHAQARCVLVTPDTVVSIAHGKHLSDSRTQCEVGSWKPGERFDLCVGPAGWRYRTIWAVEKGACVLVWNCHEVDLETRRHLNSDDWYSAKMEWDLFSLELQEILEELYVNRNQEETWEPLRKLFQLSLVEIEGEHLYVDFVPEDVKKKASALTFCKQNGKWQKWIGKQIPTGPRITLVGNKAKAGCRQVVTMFTQEFVLFDRFFRLSAPDSVMSCVSVKLPNRNSRWSSRWEAEKAKKASKAQAVGVIDLDEEPTAQRPVSSEGKFTKKVEEDEDPEFANLWAAEQWVAKNFRTRKRLVEEEELDVEAQEPGELGVDLRSSWYRAQRSDQALAHLVGKPPDGYRLAKDGLLEHFVIPVGKTNGQWVPVVPDGEAATNMSWKFFCFKQDHVGALGAHRGANKMFERLSKVCYWENMKRDLEIWVNQCIVCIRGRKRPMKQHSVAVRPSCLHCWEEVSMDFEGPVTPEDRYGNKYILTYLCCISHAVMFEPVKNLTHSEVRRAFSRLLFRSRSLPKLLRTDRGQEFKNALMEEFCALIGLRHKMSTPMRPVEMGNNERIHQENQKILGLLVHDICKAQPYEWSEMLYVVEFIIDTTPGPEGLAPRDIERAWSLAMPLEKELKAFEVLAFEPMTDYARNLFKQYREVRAKVLEWRAIASEKRAEVANRYRKVKEVELGAMVVYRDPKNRAGGRTPWRKQLSSPMQVVARRANKCDLKDEKGHIIEEVHVEDLLIIPPNALDLEKTTPVSLEPDVDEPMPLRSIGQMLEKRNEQEETPAHRPGRGKKARLVVQQYIAYSVPVANPIEKRCRVGRIRVLLDAEAVVHQFHPVHDARLRVKWHPLFRKPTGEVNLDPSGEPVVENVPYRRVISVIEMNSGVMNHASARALDRNGYRIDESIEIVMTVDSVGMSRNLGCAADVLAEELRRASFLTDITQLFATKEGVQQWLSESCCDFLEVFGGGATLTLAVGQLQMKTGEPLDKDYPAYGISWDLASETGAIRYAYLVVHILKPRAIHVATPCTEKREPLVTLALQTLDHQEAHGMLGSHENPKGSKFFDLKEVAQRFGKVGNSKLPWNHYQIDGCQFDGNLMEKSWVWTANFKLTEVALQCSARNGNLVGGTHEHAQIREQRKTPEGPWRSVATLSGRYPASLAEGYALCLKASLAEKEGLERPFVERKTELRSRASQWIKEPGYESIHTTHENEAFVPEAVPKSSESVSDEKLLEAHRTAEAKWKLLAEADCFDEVVADLEVYRFSGTVLESDPRRTKEYRSTVVDGLGFKEGEEDKRPWLTKQEYAAFREMLSRKAAAFWLPDTPRTTVRFVQHDAIPTGPPIRVPPHRLSGEAASWIDEKIEEEVKRGQLVRGNSAWGSPPFPTKDMPAHKRPRKRRIVVDYRRVNARTLRSNYYSRTAAEVVNEAAGSAFYTLLDAVTGFNQIVNTPRAREMLAILSRSGTFLPLCLTFGPQNGPEDFALVVDRVYAPGRHRKLRYMKEWLPYVDDLTIRTGRVLGGMIYRDSEVTERIREAAETADRNVNDLQTIEEALQACGFSTDGLGQHKHKFDPRRSDRNHPFAHRFTRTVYILMCVLFHVAYTSMFTYHVKRSFVRFFAVCAFCVGLDTYSSCHVSHSFNNIVNPVSNRAQVNNLCLCSGQSIAISFGAEIPGGLSTVAEMGKGKGKNRGSDRRRIDRDEGISRALSWLLRHSSLPRSAEGWMDLDVVLKERSLTTFGADASDVLQAVRTDAKGRFEIDENRVRAVSSWSDPSVTSGLAAMEWSEVPAKLYHGTKASLLGEILAVGLMPGRRLTGECGGRLHVHFTPKRSDVRKGSDIVIEVNSEDLREGLTGSLYKSANGWFMTEETVMSRYFHKVSTIDGKTLLHVRVERDAEDEPPSKRARKEKKEKKAKKRKEESPEKELPEEPTTKEGGSSSSRVVEQGESLTKRQRQELDRASGSGALLTQEAIASHETHSGFQWGKAEVEEVLQDIGRNLAEDSWQKFLAKRTFRDYLLNHGYQDLVRSLGFEACSSCVERGAKTTEAAAAFAAGRLASKRRREEDEEASISDEEGSFSPPNEGELLDAARSLMDELEVPDFDPDDASLVEVDEASPVEVDEASPVEEVPAEREKVAIMRPTSKVLPGPKKPPEPMGPPPPKLRSASVPPPWRRAEEDRTSREALEVESAGRARSEPPWKRPGKSRSRAPSPQRQKSNLVLQEAELSSGEDEGKAVKLRTREDRILNEGAEDAVTGMLFHVTHELRVHRSVVEATPEMREAVFSYAKDVFYTTRCIAWQGGNVAKGTWQANIERLTSSWMDTMQIPYDQRHQFEKWYELVAQKLVIRARANDSRCSISGLLSQGWIAALQTYNEKRLEVDYDLHDFLTEHGEESILSEAQILKLQLLRSHYESHREKLAAVEVTLQAAQRKLSAEEHSTAQYRKAVEESIEEAGGWKCNRCRETNIWSRQKCFRCSSFPSPEIAAKIERFIEEQGALGPRRRRKRGGWKERLREENASLRSEKEQKGRGKRGRKRKYDAVEADHNHPFAHPFVHPHGFGATVPAVATLGSLYILLSRRAQYVADNIAEAVSESMCQVASTPSKVILAIEVVTSRVLRSFGNFLDAMLEEANLFISTVTRAASLLVVAVLVVVAVVVVFKGFAHYADLGNWFGLGRCWYKLSAKYRLKQSGFNPEGNMISEVEIPQEWPALTRDRIAMRTLDRFEKAVGLIDNVQYLKESLFLVQSEVSHNQYRVQLIYGQEDLERFGCQCADYLTRGKPCKHVGAALLWVRRAQVAAKQSVTLATINQSAELEAVNKTSNPESEEELVEDLPTALRRAKSLQLALVPSASQPAARSSEASCWDALRIKARVIQESGGSSSTDPPPTRAADSRVSRDDRRLEESLRKIQQDLSELKLEVKSGKSSAPLPAAVEAAAPITPVNWRMLYSAESTQELIKSNINGTVKGNTIWLMSYSFDRRDLMESLAAAQRRGVRIVMISDHKQSLKGPREQLSILQELTTAGVEVRLLSGKALAEEYRRAGRNSAVSGLYGVCHLKLVLMKLGKPGQTPFYWLTTGSTNFTTSSRCNEEMNISLDLEEKGPNVAELVAHLSATYDKGIPPTEADVRAAQAARSASPSR